MVNQPVIVGLRATFSASSEITFLDPVILEELQKTYNTVSLSFLIAME